MPGLQARVLPTWFYTARPSDPHMGARGGQMAVCIPPGVLSFQVVFVNKFNLMADGCSGQ